MITTEVVDDSSGVMRARVCKVRLPTSTTFERDEPLCVAHTPAPTCAKTGELLISRFPLEPTRISVLSARLHAEFPDGTRIEAQF